ncbi:hypothetical protein BRD15_02295 [Halobacteriales archaeon SW_6_65_15]|nr:MAG: hypothetical protein BRD15_02295 [Halobacteriales archaeon SW_6_65_15]
MMNERYPQDDGGSAVPGDASPCPSQSRLALGLSALAVATAHAALQFTRGGFETEIDLLLLLLGGVLGSALMGEYVSSRCRSKLYQGFILPIIGLLVTFSLLAVSFAAGYHGHDATGVASGLLFFCSYLAFALTIDNVEAYMESV